MDYFLDSKDRITQVRPESNLGKWLAKQTMRGIDAQYSHKVWMLALGRRTQTPQTTSV
jgi:hypothetical protein